MTGRDALSMGTVQADFSRVRYAQCWEDANILLEALDPSPGDEILSIASAGDNVLALASRGLSRVVAVDLSAAQIACLRLRVVAYRALEHADLLVLLGVGRMHRAAERPALYARCRPLLDDDTCRYWDAHPEWIARGVGRIGKFEHFLDIFARWVLPLVHSRDRVRRILAGGPESERRARYDREWNNRRWRWMFRLFFSQPVVARLGRDPSFFRYVEGRGSVADRFFKRTEHALTDLDPAENPYLQWFFSGDFRTALPYALRPENFQSIRDNLSAIEVLHGSLESYLEQQPAGRFAGFNLSDLFEYVSAPHYAALLRALARCGRPGTRLAYWNLLVPRSRPPELADLLDPLSDLSTRLHRQDKAAFYEAFVVEEVRR